MGVVAQRLIPAFGVKIVPSGTPVLAPETAAQPTPGRRQRPPFLTFGRKVLLTLMGLGIIGAIIGGTMQGTRSSFTATVTNPGNNFTAGTLTMTNDNNAGTVCTQVVASACGALSFTPSLPNPMVAGTVYTAIVKITNAGSLPASMSLSIQNVTETAAGSGTGPGYQYFNLTIHDDGLNYCVYGASTGATSAANDSCRTLTNAASVFANTAVSPTAVPAGSPLPLPRSSDGTTGRWAATEQHTYSVSLELTTAGDPGAQETFDLVWVAQQ